MKAIQIMIDEELLAELDRDEDVQREGRSAFLRQAAREWLAQRRRRRISEAYRRGYAGGAGPELEGWENQGTWPEDE
jgi:metal-responsive CopG/Arc/MetJ family transcriptional regulator